jgi:hypothetical protein
MHLVDESCLCGINGLEITNDTFKRMTRACRAKFILSQLGENPSLEERLAATSELKPSTRVLVTGCCEAGGTGQYAAITGVGNEPRNFDHLGSRRSSWN